MDKITEASMGCGAGVAKFATECGGGLTKQFLDLKGSLFAPEKVLPGGVSEPQKSLQVELDKSEEERRSSITKVSHSLSDLSAKLETVNACWTPWTEVEVAKQQVADMQNAVDKQISFAKSELQMQESKTGAAEDQKVGALQGQIMKSQSERRTSLAEVSHLLNDIGAELDSAKTSWEPWKQVEGVKQKVETLRSSLGQQNDEEKLGVEKGRV